MLIISLERKTISSGKRFEYLWTSLVPKKRKFESQVAFQQEL